MKNTIDAKDLTIEKIMDGKRVKVLDGIAGSAKTSTVCRLLQENGVDYLHMTSTNRLKSDIERRFHHAASTVASGLFHTSEGGGFYAEGREVSAPVIIIDEILQTNPAVFQWIADHPEQRVIVCTDKKQMLAPVGGQRMLKELEKLETSDVAEYNDLEHSYRPITQSTEEVYKEAYAAKSSDIDLWEQFMFDYVRTEKQDDLEYSENNIYICHTNEIERDIYDRFNLRTAYEQDLIPKGAIASRLPKTRKAYPILPQADVKEHESYGYWQLSNIGSTIRYQGSEVLPGSTLYYLIPAGSIPGNREIYTMLTRAKDIKSVKVVFYEIEKDIKITTFCGLPILEKRSVLLDETNQKYKQDTYTRAEIAEIEQAAQKNRHDIHFEGVMKDGGYVKPSDIEKTEKKKSNAPTLYSLTKKNPETAMRCPNRFLKQVEKKAGVLPRPLGQFRCKVADDNKYDYNYMLDMRSSYPCCWKLGGVIDGRTYREDESGECKIYVVTGGFFFNAGDVITQPLYDYMREQLDEDDNLFRAVCVGSANYLKNDTIGEYLYESTHTTKEDKEKLHGIHWGWLRRPYIQKQGDDGYYINKSNVYELLFASITSTQALLMAKVAMAIYGRLITGTCTIDAFYFNTNRDITELGDCIKSVLPEGYDFRIYTPAKKLWEGKASKNTILYKTYEELPSKADIRKEKHREVAKLSARRRRAEKKAGATC